MRTQSHLVHPIFVSVPHVKAKGAGVSRVRPKINWDKYRGKEPERSKRNNPLFWGWDERTIDFTGGPNSKAKISATAITRSPESSELGSHRNEQA